MSEEKYKRTKWLHIRLLPQEHEQLTLCFKNTTCRKLSDFVRRLLLQKKITVYTRNQSLDDFLAEMILLRNELSALGNNFNQVVKKLYTLQHIPEFKTWMILNESSKNAFLKKVEEIKQYMAQMEEQWSQE